MALASPRPLGTWNLPMRLALTKYQVNSYDWLALFLQGSLASSVTTSLFYERANNSLTSDGDRKRSTDRKPA